MSELFFTGSREHALLARVIDEAGKTRTKGYLGRTALQKVMYFLRVLGVPTRYAFAIHHFGPFCEDVGADMELLIADGIVIDKGEPGQRYSNYAIADVERAEHLQDRHRDFINQHSRAVETVVAVFGGLGPDDLELYATLHYAFRYQQATLTSGAPTRADVMGRFKEYKGNKFPTARLDAAYDAMVTARLIERQDTVAESAST